MPRPKLYTDDQVLDCALTVLLNKGPAAFTLSDVASAVGLSRAALIQRFTDKATLHLRVMERLTQQVRDYFDDLPHPGDPSQLRTLLQDLISGMGAGEGTEGYLLLMWSDVREPALRRLAVERNQRVRSAIADRLPSEPTDPQDAAALIQSVIQGSCMQWLVEPEGDLADYMLKRTLTLVDRLYPPA